MIVNAKLENESPMTTVAILLMSTEQQLKVSYLGLKHVPNY